MDNNLRDTRYEIRDTKDEIRKTLDICMIVKNEAENLLRTLPNNVAGADNVIVVDTGSSDKTKEIAASLGAKVFDFKWEDDFAAARNFSLSQSDADWILWLDADEYIEIEDFKKLKYIINETDCNILRLQIHECNYGSKNSNGFYYRDKLFMNKLGIRFERPINEQLVFPEKIIVEEQRLDVNIFHWGRYLSQEALDAKNKERIELYKNSLKGNPKDALYPYLIANKYDELHEFDLALEFYNQAIERSSDDENLKPIKEAAHLLKAWNLLKNNRYEEAIKEANNFLEMDKNHVEPYCIIAESHIALNNISDAIEVLKIAVTLSKKDHSIIGQRDFFWDVQIFIQYGYCAACCNDYETALLYYKKAYASFPIESTSKIIKSLQGITESIKTRQETLIYS